MYRQAVFVMTSHPDAVAKNIMTMAGKHQIVSVSHSLNPSGLTVSLIVVIAGPVGAMKEHEEWVGEYLDLAQSSS